jgi:hypothetical protein
MIVEDNKRDSNESFQLPQHINLIWPHVAESRRWQVFIPSGDANMGPGSTTAQATNYQVQMGVQDQALTRSHHPET